MKHLIAIGACYLDTILSVPHLPEEDSKLRATKLEVRRGGNCPNSLQVLEQLLSRGSGKQQLATHLVTCLPSAESPATAKILSSFGPATRIDFSHCLYREDQVEPASSYIIRSEETGSRTIVNYNGLSEMTTDEFVKIADAFKHEQDSWWHFEGRFPETTLRCITHLRASLPQCRISVEVERPNREGLRELAAEADVVFYSRSWAESQGYPDAEACLKGEAPSRASLIMCTWGSGGAWALQVPTQTSFHGPVKADAGLKVVDSIGAGDTFVAGALYGLLCHTNDWDERRKLSFAVDLATAKVQIEGFEGLAAKLLPSTDC